MVEINYFDNLSGIIKYCPKKSDLNPNENIIINNSLASINNSNYSERVQCIDVPKDANLSENNCFDACRSNDNCTMASYKNMTDPIKNKCLLNKRINFNSAYPTRFPCKPGENCNTCHLYHVKKPKCNWMSDKINLMSDQNVRTMVKNHNDKVSRVAINNYIPTNNYSDLCNHNQLSKYNKVDKWNKWDNKTLNYNCPLCPKPTKCS